MNAWYPTSFFIGPDMGGALDRSLRVPCGSENENISTN